jgi:NADH-quinone oxidoreductase subunit M
VIEGVGAALWGPLLLAAGLMLRMRSARVARLVAVVLLGLVLTASSGLLLLLAVGDEATRQALFSVRASYADALAAAIIPILVASPLATILSAPRAVVTVEASSDAVLLAGCALGAMLAEGLPSMGAFALLAFLPLAREARRSSDTALRGAARFLVATTTAPTVLGIGAAVGFAAVAGVRWPFDPREIAEAAALGRHGWWIGSILWIGVAARLGVFPFHAWVPVVAERLRGPLGSMTIVSPIGALIALKACLQLFPDGVSGFVTLLLPLAAASSAYGALLAIGQDHAGRQLGYLWVSVSGSVLAGLCSLDSRAVAGALLQLLAVLLSMTGLWIQLRAVACRTTTEDMRRLGGLVRTAPGIATGFLLLALATVSFPGTPTFFSEDLLVQGLLEDHPVAGGVLLVATALNGITLVRSFKRIFLGEPTAHAPARTVEDVLPRERVASLAIVFALLIGGLAPTPLLLLKEGVKGTLGAGP